MKPVNKDIRNQGDDTYDTYTRILITSKRGQALLTLYIFDYINFRRSK